MNWQRHFEDKVRINEQLSRHTSFKIGGIAQYWFQPRDISDLQEMVALTVKKRLNLRAIGAGSNILVNDAGVRGIVIKLSSPCFKGITVITHNRLIQDDTAESMDVEGNQQVISVGAGLVLVELVRYTQENGLSGCELLAGIPGTVGGALIMNAGNIGDRVLNVLVMDEFGRLKTLQSKSLRFSYRDSNLTPYIILSVRLKLIKKNGKTIRAKIDEYLDYRQRTQDLSLPSAGCIFKNPTSKSAAYFIERCGLKGRSFGDATVSFKHANFILNKGRASFTDITGLMAYITECVKKRFNVDLEPEIKIWSK